MGSFIAEPSFGEVADYGVRSAGFFEVIRITELLQFEMTDDDFHAVPAAQMPGELFGEVDRAMLAAGAAESHH